MKHLLLILTIPLVCSCTAQPSSVGNAEYQRQLDEFDRQTAVTDKHMERNRAQLDETDSQLARTKQQADRFDALLDRWEQQADRQDQIFDAVERIIATKDEHSANDN